MDSFIYNPIFFALVFVGFFQRIFAFSDLRNAILVVPRLRCLAGTTIQGFQLTNGAGQKFAKIVISVRPKDNSRTNTIGPLPKFEFEMPPQCMCGGFNLVFAQRLGNVLPDIGAGLDQRASFDRPAMEGERCFLL